VVRFEIPSAWAVGLLLIKTVMHLLTQVQNFNLQRMGRTDMVGCFWLLNRSFPCRSVTLMSEDKVVLRWSATMTHRGDHLGMPATGKLVRLTGITVVRIRDKQIIEGWDNWDQLGMLKQIGAYESPQTTFLKSA
jgi:SnoaL-like polyketide cyclase